MTVPTLEECVRVLGPPKGWKGHCYSVACTLNRELGLGWREVYGHYLGRVHPKSYFGKRARILPFQNHGWLELPDGRVFDPTRWVFENAPPYLYVSDPPCGCFAFENASDDEYDVPVCHCGHVQEEHGALGECLVGPGEEYDEGGDRFRQRLEDRHPPPAYDPAARKCPLALAGPAADFVTFLYGTAPQLLTLDQVFHLANLSRAMLGPCAGAVYRAVEAAGHGAFLPLDNYELILGKKKQSRTP
jgi:hypothetical protein